MMCLPNLFRREAETLFHGLRDTLTNEAVDIEAKQIKILCVTLKLQTSPVIGCPAGVLVHVMVSNVPSVTVIISVAPPHFLPANQADLLARLKSVVTGHKEGPPPTIIFLFPFPLLWPRIGI